MSEKIIITGATGFIGSHLVPYLLSLDYEVHVIVRRHISNMHCAVHTCELLDEIKLLEIFEKTNPDFLIHLASYAVPGRNLDHFEIQYVNTVLPALTLARLIPKSIKLALFIGSCEEYGHGQAPFEEDQPLYCFSPYGWGKISAYYGVHMIATQRNIPWCWARPFLTFGPGQKNEQLIPSLIKGCLLDDDIPLSPGDQTRDFIYVKDLCEMLEFLIQSPELINGKAINLCNGIPVKVKDLALSIQRFIGKGNIQLGKLPYRADEAMSFFGSKKKYEQLFGSYNFTPFNEALHQTISYFRKELNQ